MTTTCFSRRTQIESFFIALLLIAPILGVVPTVNSTTGTDGKIAFHSYRDGNWEIYLMNADGSGQSRITHNNALDGRPFWSPDGSKIAFTSDRDGNTEVYVMNADGSRQSRLTTNNAQEENSGWSPDGTKILFSSNRDGNWEIYLMKADGSTQTRLTNNSYEDGVPSWSPDGSKIAFVSSRDGNAEIYVMNVDGSGQTRLTNNSAGDWDPNWSPDGTKITYSSDRSGNVDIYVMNPDGSGQTRLTNNGAPDYRPFWSPDGSRIGFASERDGNAETYVMNADGSGQTRLTFNSASDVGCSWKTIQQKTNGKIAYISDSDGNWNNWDIYVINPNGTGRTRLTSNPDSGDPSWSPDGTKIAFSSDRVGHSQIYVMNADGSGQTRLTNNNGNDEQPNWSPDGSRIAFCSDRDGNWEIYVMNADGSGQTRLTNNGYVDARPMFSPDGTKISWDSDRGIHWDIYVMDADGSGQTRLTLNSGIYDGEESWSPDSARMAFTSDRDDNYEIYIMYVNGTGVTRLTNNDYDDGEIAWSPDGNKIVFASTRDGNYELYIMNVDGTEQTRLTNTSTNEWAPSWQGLSKKTAALTLQSSTTNTMVDTSFNLNASLSVSKSGTVTLYWSINGSGFGFRRDETMTNGTFSRTFAASSPGVWAFKLVWPGDEEYQSTESNSVIVTVVKPNATLTLQPSASSLVAGSSVTINIAVSSNGTPVTGATVMLASNKGGSFSSVTDNGNGTYKATFTAPSVATATVLTVSALASKTGYAISPAQTQLTVQPLLSLTIVATANPVTVYSGGTSTIRVSLSSGGTAVTGATVNLASSNGGTFSNMTDQGNGTYVATFTAPDKTGQTTCTITASATKTGYEAAQAQTQVTVQPLVINIYVKASDGTPIAGATVVSTSQPSGQAALSKTTDSSGLASFAGVLKGSYTFKATMTGYDDKTWTFTVQAGQTATETATLTKPSGIPGFPYEAIALGIILAVAILWAMQQRH